MTVTLIVRLLREPLEERRLVGHAEVVATGLARPVRDAADLVALARQAADADPVPPPRPPRGKRRA